MSAAGDQATGARRGRGRAVVPAALLVALLVLACPAWGWLGFTLAGAATRCHALGGYAEMDRQVVAYVEVPAMVCRKPGGWHDLTLPLWDLRRGEGLPRNWEEP